MTTCNSCQVNKPWNRTGKGPLQPIPLPELPLLDVGLDFVGLLPVSKNRNIFLLTVVNYKTRITKFVACKSDPDNGEAISAQSSTSSTSVDSTGYPLCYTPTAAGSSPASSSAKSSGSAAQSRLSGPPITLNHKGSLNTPIVLVSKPFGITSRESSKICQQPSSH